MSSAPTSVFQRATKGFSSSFGLTIAKLRCFNSEVEPSARVTAGTDIWSASEVNRHQARHQVLHRSVKVGVVVVSSVGITRLVFDIRFAES